MSLLADRYLEKYAKKLVGRTDIEDALKRLDRLTCHEAWMGIAQNLKATHTVDERVKGVADTVVAVDNRVAEVDDRVAGVSEQVASVSGQVAGVDDRVQQMADEAKRMSSPKLIGADCRLTHPFREPIARKHP